MVWYVNVYGRNFWSGMFNVYGRNLWSGMLMSMEETNGLVCLMSMGKKQWSTVCLMYLEETNGLVCLMSMEETYDLVC